MEAVTVSLIRLNWRKPERTLRMLIRWIWVRERINGLRKWKNFNQFLHTQFGIGYDVKAELEARITAVVAGMEDQKQIATTAFTLTYQPVTTTLYLIGDATPNGWSADNATAMERTDNGQFTWTGKLNTGSLKFITTLRRIPAVVQP